MTTSVAQALAEKPQAPRSKKSVGQLFRMTIFREAMAGPRDLLSALVEGERWFEPSCLRRLVLAANTTCSKAF